MTSGRFGKKLSTRRLIPSRPPGKYSLAQKDRQLNDTKVSVRSGFGVSTLAGSWLRPEGTCPLRAAEPAAGAGAWF
ncbi:hypothetical protein DIPPA_35777 [Diplonema papillatum]|nr:hypothetical protein DIPPA_24926 [Diplonema papillatum]KAJ9441288.1 hypothetical protein DIPPA_35777 [Diplonema papillatum]